MADLTVNQFGMEKCDPSATRLFGTVKGWNTCFATSCSVLTEHTWLPNNFRGESLSHTKMMSWYNDTNTMLIRNSLSKEQRKWMARMLKRGENEIPLRKLPYAPGPSSLVLFAPPGSGSLGFQTLPALPADWTSSLLHARQVLWAMALPEEGPFPGCDRALKQKD